MGATSGVLTSVKNPEYTGENRCLPCTVVNTLIAVAMSVAVGVAVVPASSTVAGLAAGGAVFGLSVASIYLRGYLVPGTPELTKQYFPPWLLALFGKGPAQQTSEYDSDLDPEQALQDVGALEPCETGDDLCLTEEFKGEWNSEIERVKAEDASRERLLDLLDIDEGDVTFTEFGDAFQVLLNDRAVGKWESEAAFLADLGAANVLAGRYANWEEMPVGEQSQLLNGLRLFIDTCPECGGIPEFGTDTVESCCSTHEVAAVACTDCEARLFESQPL
jgi:hypothetical protein